LQGGGFPSFEDTIELLTQSKSKADAWAEITADNCEKLIAVIHDTVLPADVALELEDLVSDPFFYRHCATAAPAPYAAWPAPPHGRPYYAGGVGGSNGSSGGGWGAASPTAAGSGAGVSAEPGRSRAPSLSSTSSALAAGVTVAAIDNLDALPAGPQAIVRSAQIMTKLEGVL